jgi:hypothetical protein
MKYGKPIWVTEFACVDGKWLCFFLIKAFHLLAHPVDTQGFTPCSDQQEINNFINEIVPYLQGNPNISAYAYSNGLGLGELWPLMQGNSLRYSFFLMQCIKILSSCCHSESGKTYLAAIEKYHWWKSWCVDSASPRPFHVVIILLKTLEL